MAVPYDRKTTHLLVGGETLVHHQAQDGQGTCAEYWDHQIDGKSQRFLSRRAMNDDDKAYLDNLRQREVSINPEIFGRGYAAVLPDGRQIRKDMVAFPLDHPDLVKFDTYKVVIFRNQDAAIALLKDDPVVRNYVAQPAPEPSEEASVAQTRRAAGALQPR